MFRKFTILIAFIFLLAFLTPAIIGCGTATNLKNWVTGSSSGETRRRIPRLPRPSKRR